MQIERISLRRRGSPPRRRGFTLVETIIAVGLGAVIMGGAMAMLSFGNRSFYKTTEHSAFRAESMLMIEKVGRDLEQVVVSPRGVNPLPEANGELSILSPYVLTGREIPYSIPNPDDPDGPPLKVKASDGITFFRYHHIEMDTGVAGAPTGGMPRIIGRKVVFETRDRQDGKGKDLYRNDVKLNDQPLHEVVFHQEDPITTAHQVKGSPHAIVTIKVVPQGGMKGHFGANQEMSLKILEGLRNSGSIVEKTFHLVGYESMYTNMLYKALQRIRGHIGNEADTSGVDIPFNDQTARQYYQAALQNYEIELKLFEDAYINSDTAAPAHISAKLVAGMGDRAAKAFDFPDAVFAVEDVPFVPDDTDAYSDKGFLNAAVLPGAVNSADGSSVGGEGLGQGNRGAGGAGSNAGSGAGS